MFRTEACDLEHILSFISSVLKNARLTKQSQVSSFWHLKKREGSLFVIPWFLLRNSCAQYSSPAGVGLRLSWWQVMEDVEGMRVKNRRSTGEKREWKGGAWTGAEERGSSYDDEGSSSLSGVTGRPCKKEIETTCNYVFFLLRLIHVKSLSWIRGFPKAWLCGPPYPEPWWYLDSE